MIFGAFIIGSLVGAALSIANGNSGGATLVVSLCCLLGGHEYVDTQTSAEPSRQGDPGA